MNAISAIEPGLSTLQKHCSEVQTTATQLCGVLQAIELLDNEGIGADALTALIGVALGLATKIDSDLDSVNLPGDLA